MKPSKRVRDAIDELSLAELQYEIQRGKDSRFSRAIPYMKKRLDELRGDKEAQKQDEDLLNKDEDDGPGLQIGIGAVMFLIALIPFCSRLT
jgi:hypothetical protein